MIKEVNGLIIAQGVICCNSFILKTLYSRRDKRCREYDGIMRSDNIKAFCNILITKEIR
jgi:hypothetical protein